jgi:hypothetical protein
MKSSKYDFKAGISLRTLVPDTLMLSGFPTKLPHLTFAIPATCALFTTFATGDILFTDDFESYTTDVNFDDFTRWADGEGWKIGWDDGDDDFVLGGCSGGEDFEGLRWRA